MLPYGMGIIKRSRFEAGIWLLGCYAPVEKGFKTPCWICSYSPLKNGYVSLSWNENGSIQRGYAHRMSFEIHNGPIPNGFLVCHRCDVRNCINPDHLFTGTHKDNAQDKVRKGRSNTARGESSAKSKIKESDVLKIRSLSKNGFTDLEIAGMYGISDNQVSNIALGLSWRHVGGPVRQPKSPAKLSVKSVSEIKNQIKLGLINQREASVFYGVNPSTISNIMTGKKWKGVV